MGNGKSAASALRDLRRSQGRTLRSAAAELGIAPSQLSRIERGERSIGDAAAKRLSDYYAVPTEVIDLLRGQLPSDVVAILQQHPEEIVVLREKYGKR
ncbi:helix-turn-helix domain-containing protein [Microbacterium enclense]|uniref:helix-turn-helix domain-containing protein n=1 Tax=Microbacterium enclense TaxID=993073 RepID=UPI003557476D